ncbi:DUF4037 domain-containing protein, partial [Mesorhizobium sp.]|uniref:DUF4037 domain-containing protein n=1 Tax=Mesorhizobium sp. TaxID=1871066 RepID=UPI00257C1818
MLLPPDVWLYKLAAQWGRIAEERAYIGRTGNAGDEIGSRVIAARMVGNIMRLAMLVERRYAPYPKWFGTAFARLPCAPELRETLEQILSAPDWPKREAGLFDACRFIAELQMARGVPGAIAPSVGSLHNRPFRFVDSLQIGNALRSAIADRELRELPEFGAADQSISSNASIDLILPERLGPLRTRAGWFTACAAKWAQRVLRLPAAGHRGSPFASCSARGEPGRCPPLPTDRMSA